MSATSLVGGTEDYTHQAAARMTGRYRYIDFERSLGGGAPAVSARLLSQEP